MTFPLDRRSPPAEDYQRLVLDDLLYFFPGPHVMLSAYLDESGTHGDSPVMCVSGLLYTGDALRLLDQEWKDALDTAGVTYFHAVESSHLRGEFKNVTKDEEAALWKRLIGLTKRYACGGAAAYITSEGQFNDYRRANGWEYSQYTTCAYACVRVLLDTAEKLDDGRVDLTIESGHKDMGELDAFLRRLTEAGLALTHGFRGKKDLRPLQTADLWAYEAWKRVNDQLVSPRRVRKSLEVLIKDELNMRILPLNRESLPVLFDEVAALLGSGTN